QKLPVSEPNARIRKLAPGASPTSSLGEPHGPRAGPPLDDRPRGEWGPIIQGRWPLPARFVGWVQPTDVCRGRPGHLRRSSRWVALTLLTSTSPGGGLGARRGDQIAPGQVRDEVAAGLAVAIAV